MRWLVCAALVIAAGPRAAGAQTEPAWDSYHRAFVMVAEGKTDEARALLREVIARFPGQEVAQLAQARLGELDAGRPPRRDAPETEEGVITAEKPRKLARAELGLYSTFNGISAGVLMCQLAGCDSARAETAALIAGGGLGLGASLLATRDGITQGRTQLVNSSIFWGTVNGALTAGIVDGDDTDTAGIVLGAEVLGLAASFGLWEGWRPSSGDVALANTGGVWTPILVLLLHGVVDTEPKLETMMVAVDGGLLIGGLLSTKYRVSRGRTLLIDVGGVVGALAGGLVVVAAEPDSTGAIFTPILIGTAGGLALAAYSTRDWDIPKAPPVNAAIAPMGDRGWGALVSFDLDL